jgi:predicted ATP-grasp superfamily ATP-dependent carboligase
MLLEINARPWLHFWLSKKCGVDILFSSYLDAIGTKLRISEEYITGIKSLFFVRDLIASTKMIQTGQLSFLEWIKSIRGKKQLTLIDKNDSLPFFYWIFENVQNFFVLGKRLSFN